MLLAMAQVAMPGKGGKEKENMGLTASNILYQMLEVVDAGPEHGMLLRCYLALPLEGLELYVGSISSALGGILERARCLLVDMGG